MDDPWSSDTTKVKKKKDTTNTIIIYHTSMLMKYKLIRIKVMYEGSLTEMDYLFCTELYGYLIHICMA